MDKSDEVKMHEWKLLCKACGMGYINAHCDDVFDNPAYDTIVEDYYSVKRDTKTLEIWARGG